MSYLKAGNRIGTGCKSLDDLIGGGLQPKKITLLYGEFTTGKTTIALQCAINSARMGYKTLYIDSDNRFSTDRLQQTSQGDLDWVSKLILIASPSTFQEQRDTIDCLNRLLTEKFGLIIIDTITSLYRTESYCEDEVFALNRELNQQVATLANVARTISIPILILGQVRSSSNNEYEDIEPVAIRVLRFWSDTVISLRSTSQRNIVRATLECGPRNKNSRCLLIIGNSGIADLEYQFD